MEAPDLVEGALYAGPGDGSHRQQGCGREATGGPGPALGGQPWQADEEGGQAAHPEAGGGEVGQLHRHPPPAQRAGRGHVAGTDIAPHAGHAQDHHGSHRPPPQPRGPSDDQCRDDGQRGHGDGDEAEQELVGERGVEEPREAEAGRVELVGADADGPRGCRHHAGRQQHGEPVLELLEADQAHRAAADQEHEPRVDEPAGDEVRSRGARCPRRLRPRRCGCGRGHPHPEGEGARGQVAVDPGHRPPRDRVDALGKGPQGHPQGEGLARHHRRGACGVVAPAGVEHVQRRQPRVRLLAEAHPRLTRRLGQGRTRVGERALAQGVGARRHPPGQDREGDDGEGGEEAGPEAGHRLAITTGVRSSPRPAPLPPPPRPRPGRRFPRSGPLRPCPWPSWPPWRSTGPARWRSRPEG